MKRHNWILDTCAACGCVRQWHRTATVSTRTRKAGSRKVRRYLPNGSSIWVYARPDCAPKGGAA